MNKDFFQVSGKEEDSVKTRKRKDIAIFLKLLSSKVKDKTIINILKRLREEAGGLLPSEISYLFNIPDADMVFRSKTKYKKQYEPEVKVFEAPVFGKPKLTKPLLIFRGIEPRYRVSAPFDINGIPQVIQREPKKIKFKEIKIRDDLYPRGIGSDIVLKRIQELSEANKNELEKEPVLVNQKNELIDGYLRLMAMKRMQKNSEDFDVFVVQLNTRDDRQLKEQMFIYNSRHGTPLDKSAKKQYAQELVKIDNKTSQEVSKILGVSRQTINNWTKKIRLSQKKKQENEILIMRKNGYTQAEIAKRAGILQSTVSRIIEKANSSKINKSSINPSVIFYTNYWNFMKAEKIKNEKETYFGKTPECYIKNLLYYHTEPNEIIVDFFAGTGTTWHVSDKMSRICYCSDRTPLGGKEHIIKKWDVIDGLPNDLPDVIDLVFLDPPYWGQAEDEYSTSPNDLGNMTIEMYNQTMQKLFDNIKKHKIKRVAFLINPTIYVDGEFVFVDHTFDFHDMIKNQYDIIARYALYSPSEKLTTLKQKAQDLKKCAIFMRDLVVYERNH